LQRKPIKTTERDTAMSSFDAEMAAKNLLRQAETKIEEDGLRQGDPFTIEETLSAKQSVSITNILRLIASGQRYKARWRRSELGENDKPNIHHFTVN